MMYITTHQAMHDADRNVFYMNEAVRVMELKVGFDTSKHERLAQRYV